MDEKKELKPEEVSSVVGGMRLGKPRKKPALAYGGPCVRPKFPIKPEKMILKYGGPAVRPKPKNPEEALGPVKPEEPKK